MELVYLWVKKYKNIYEQGFNFSPRFHCEFKPVYKDDKEEVLDEEKSKLIICDKEDKNCKEKEECKKFCHEPYIKNFFDDNGNINVTAIVGKNGSGKSSILNAFGQFWDNNISYIFYQNSQLYSNHFDKNTSNYSILKEDIDISNIIYLNKMFFMELDKGGFFNHFSVEKKNIYRELFQERVDKKDNILDRGLFHKNILEIIFNGSLNFLYFKPKYIEISFNNLHKHFNKDYEVNKIYRDDTKKEKLLSSKKAKYKIYLKSLKIIEEQSKEDSIIEFYKQDIEKILDFDYNNYENPYLNNKPEDESIDNFLNKFTIDNTDILFSKKYLFKDFKKEFFNKEKSKNIFFYLYRIGFLEYDFYDDKGNRFSNLSSGEKSLFIDFNLIRKNINRYIKENNDLKKNIELLLFLDELDLTLHPDWQKSYIENILDMLKQYKNVKFHIIMTTHSPFLLSDIPKQNIIFLDTYKENDKEVKNKKQKIGNCKVLSHDEVLNKKQTFGANIHTLLSDSFFMEDGLMGEFAKSKINNIKKLYQLIQNENVQERLKEETTKELAQKSFNRRKKRLWQIQKIIGEPFLQTVIKNYLDEIENILFEDKAKKIAIERFIKEFGKDAISEVMNNDKN